MGGDGYARGRGEVCGEVGVGLRGRGWGRCRGWGSRAQCDSEGLHPREGRLEAAGDPGILLLPLISGHEGDTGAAEGRSEEVPPLANFVTPRRWQSGSSLKNTIQKFLCKGTASGSQDSAKDAVAFQSLQFLSLSKLLKLVLGPVGTSPSCALLPLVPSPVV